MFTTRRSVPISKWYYMLMSQFIFFLDAAQCVIETVLLKYLHYDGCICNSSNVIVLFFSGRRQLSTKGCRFKTCFWSYMGGFAKC